MKLLARSISACALLSISAFAQEPAIPSPRADYLNPIRILLYVPGTDLLFDYPDVCRVLCSAAAQISFETRDGTVVTHQGTYTIIQARNAIAEAPRRHLPSLGPRFYDIK